MIENDKKMKRVRAVSAKPSPQKNRPMSGSSTRNMNKIEFIQNFYGGILSNKRVSDRNGFKIGLNGEEHHVSRTGYTKICKEKEELLEENMQLKTENNKLKQKLSHQKSKIEIMRIKLNEETKGIGVQFQKQAYWSGSNANMVRGLKNQYWHLKQKYEQKCSEFNELTKQFQISKSREQSKYTLSLQTQIERLKKRLQQLFKESKLLQHNTITTLVEYQTEVDRKLKLQLLEQNERLNEYLKQLKNKLKITYNNIEQKDKKIKFLDKLIIQKSNLEHGAIRKIKQLEKEKENINNQLNQIKKQKDNLSELYDSKIKRLKDTHDKQFETERIIFKNQLVQKSDRINKLQKQLAYLTTLMSYWKPLDDIQDPNSNMFLLSNPVESQKQIVLEYSMNSTVIKYNQSRHHSKIPSQQQDEEEYETKSIVANSRKGSVDQGYRNVSDVMTKSIDVRKGPEKKREQITADKRNTEEGVKSRKVDFRDVQDIFETLKYRFIGLGISIDQIRKYFDYTERNEVSQQERIWMKQYITMREVEILLKNQIFGLIDNDARLLSRFLIQSSNSDEVYCDPNNQNLRTIVKSIIQSKVGQYSFPKNQADVTTRGNDLLSKFQTNLQSALRSTVPKGLISKRKLLQLFKGLGIELTRELQDYFIGKIIIKSENLLNLKYKVLFEK